MRDNRVSKQKVYGEERHSCSIQKIITEKVTKSSFDHKTSDLFKVS